MMKWKNSLKEFIIDVSKDFSFLPCLTLFERFQVSVTLINDLQKMQLNLFIDENQRVATF